MLVTALRHLIVDVCFCVGIVHDLPDVTLGIVCQLRNLSHIEGHLETLAAGLEHGAVAHIQGHTGIGMTHGAKHVDSAVFIVDVRADGFTHGDAVAGAAGMGEDMYRLLALVIIEQRLHLVHDLLVPGERAGGNHGCLAGNADLAAFVLSDNANHFAGIVGDEFLRGSIVEDLTALGHKILQQCGGNQPAASAGADHGVDTSVVPGGSNLLLQTHGAEGIGIILIELFKVVLIHQPVDPVTVGVKETLQEFLVDVVAGSLLQELLIGLLTGIGLSCGSMQLGIVNREAGCIPCRTADLKVLLQDDYLCAHILCLCGSSHTGSAGADDADITGDLNGIVGLSLGLGNVGVGDGCVVADSLTGAAIHTFLGVDPVLIVSESDGLSGTLHTTAVATGAVFLIDDICHDTYLLFL